MRDATAVACGVLLSLGGTAFAGGTLQRPVPVVQLTRKVLQERFPGHDGNRVLADLQARAKARQWKPSKAWLEGDGKKYGRLLIVSDLHPGPGDMALGADTSEENIARLLERVRPDYVQYDCKGHSGWAGYPTALGNAAPHIEKDALEIWRKATRERGIGLFIHYSGVFDMRAAAEICVYTNDNLAIEELPCS